MLIRCTCPVLFFFTDPTPTEIYTLSLHDALPIFAETPRLEEVAPGLVPGGVELVGVRILTFRDVVVGDRALRLAGFGIGVDRKSTRLNSSHSQISYAVFCLKKKKKKENELITNHY